MPDSRRQEDSALFRGHARQRELMATLATSYFDAHIGTEWLEIGPDRTRTRLAVEKHHLQPGGSVHGGVFATLAESMCSVATYGAVIDDGMTIMGQSNDVSLLRPISEGHLNGVARPRHRGRTTWVWDVEISDDDERLCALARVTIAVRPRPGGG
jgi:1,4-dihydroxy-2-naphthoyl-CoA hydrolase